MIACVATTPAVDRLLTVDGAVTPGAIHRPSSVVAVAGGKGLNVARAAASLGAAVRAVAPLGGAGGRWIAEELARDGVDVRAVKVRSEPRVCVSVAGDAAGLTEFYEPAAPMSAEEWEAFEAAVADAARSADWLTLSGSLPPGAPPDGHGRLVALARAAGARVALDGHGAALRSGLTGDPELVKVNEEEVEELLAPGADARHLQRVPTQIAVVTRGERGLEAFAGEALLRATAPAVGPYPVGAGDATLAGMVVALEAGGSLEAALSLGAAVGAASAEVPGAGRFDPRRAMELARLVEVT